MKVTALRCVPKPSLNGKAARSFSDFDFMLPDGTAYTGPLWSKSAIEKFNACPRKWAWQAIAGIREPMGAAAQLGVDLHGELEAWLKDGTVPTSKAIVDSGMLTVLPMPKTDGMRVESAFALLVEHTDASGAARCTGFWGFKDVEHGSTVYDLKTKRDLLYAMSREELSNDLQACLYGLDNCLQTGSNEATLKWVYLQVQGKARFQITEVERHIRDLESVVTAYLDSAMKMEQYAQRKSSLAILDVPADPGFCAEYGGCFYRNHHCTDLKAGTSLMAQLNHDRHENARRKALAPKENNMAINPVLARIQADLAKKQSTGTLPVTTPDVAAAVEAAPKVVMSQPVEPMVQPPVVAPVPTPVVAAPVANDPPPSPATAARLAQLKEMLSKQPSAAPAPVVMQPVAQPAAPAPVVEQPAKKRGRPSKADLALRAAAQSPSTSPGFTLYIDCLPVKGITLTNVDDLLAPIREKVESEEGAGMHYRLIEYGKGPALLAASLEESFAANPPVGDYFVMSKVTDAPVLEVLIRTAGTVVKGAW